jgi:hypothetical protein
MNLAEFAPDYARAQKITLALARPLDRRLPYRPVEITVTLADDAQAAGLVLPIELTVMPPRRKIQRVHVYRRLVPATVIFVPSEGGQHLVRLAEAAHNRWYGSLVVDVEGEPLED